jgi:hypothetical protein
VLPWPLLRAGRAGRGTEPNVRETAFRHARGVPLTGDVELHMRASDLRHGHASDAAYNGVVLHLVWEDDRGELAGTPTVLPSDALVPTTAVGAALGDSRRLRRLVRRGPSRTKPRNASSAGREANPTLQIVRSEGRRTAERLVELRGWDGTWAELLVRSLRVSVGRRAESDAERNALATAVTVALAEPLARGLRALAIERKPSVLTEGLRHRASQSVHGQARSAGTRRCRYWRREPPRTAITELAEATAALIDRWPAPRPYGRTERLWTLIEPDRAAGTGRGTLYAQGLLHLQDLRCERGGCGVCPLSATSDSIAEGSFS